MFVPDWTEFALDRSSYSANFLTHLRRRWPDRVWPASLDRMSPRLAKLSFYNNAALLSLTEPDLPAPNERYFLIDDEEAIALNWTNEPIYITNERDGMKFTPTTLIAYAKFFFHMVRGQLGHFIIVESPDELLWLSDEARARG